MSMSDVASFRHSISDYLVTSPMLIFICILQVNFFIILDLFDGAFGVNIIFFCLGAFIATRTAFFAMFFTLRVLLAALFKLRDG